jgi:hypothetical protein
MHDLHAVQINETLKRIEERLADIGDATPTMRDRFALAIAMGDATTTLDERLMEDTGMTVEQYARRLYDVAEALDAERRRRNEEDGR